MFDTVSVLTWSQKKEPFGNQTQVKRTKSQGFRVFVTQLPSAEAAYKKSKN